MGLSRGLCARCEPVDANGPSMVALSGFGSKTSLLDRSQTQLVHETINPTFPTPNPLELQHLLQPATAIGLAALREIIPQLYPDHGILAAPRSSALELVLIQPAPADPQSLATFHQAVRLPISFESLDHFVELPGSWPKMPKAFFKMSLCRLTRSSSLSRLLIRSSPAASVVPPAPSLP